MLVVAVVTRRRVVSVQRQHVAHVRGDGTKSRCGCAASMQLGWHGCVCLRVVLSCCNDIFAFAPVSLPVLNPSGYRARPPLGAPPPTPDHWHWHWHLRLQVHVWDSGVSDTASQQAAPSPGRRQICNSDSPSKPCAWPPASASLRLAGAASEPELAPPASPNASGGGEQSNSSSSALAAASPRVASGTEADAGADAGAAGDGDAAGRCCTACIMPVTPTTAPSKPHLCSIGAIVRLALWVRVGFMARVCVVWAHVCVREGEVGPCVCVEGVRGGVSSSWLWWLPQHGQLHWQRLKLKHTCALDTQ